MNLPALAITFAILGGGSYLLFLFRKGTRKRQYLEFANCVLGQAVIDGRLPRELAKDEAISFIVRTVIPSASFTQPRGGMNIPAATNETLRFVSPLYHYLLHSDWHAGVRRFAAKGELSRV
jgi:hypothetical protein